MHIYTYNSIGSVSLAEPKLGCMPLMKRMLHFGNILQVVGKGMDIRLRAVCGYRQGL